MTTSPPQALAPWETVVFERAMAPGPYTFRIPSLLCTRGGTLLAMCEMRHLGSEGDQLQNKIVLRRSSDGGRNWSELGIVVEDGANSLNNPTVVQDCRTGRIHLMYQRYPVGIDQHNVQAGYEGDQISRTFVVHSDDDGRSWSPPRDITREVKRPGATTVMSGPGVGIQLRRSGHAGRLVMPFYQHPEPYFVYAVFSDDGGETWTSGELAANADRGCGNEDQIVERVDGTLLLNCRSMAGAACRKTATSRDGGRTWSGLVDEPALAGPQCQGSIIRYSDPLDGQPSRLLLSAATSTTAREHGVVHLSLDDGYTWPVHRMLRRGSFAYSCLAVLPDGDIGCLFETVAGKHMQLVFSRFSLAWILNACEQQIGSHAADAAATSRPDTDPSLR